MLSCPWGIPDTPKGTEQLMDGKCTLLHPHLFAELGTAGGSTWNAKERIREFAQQPRVLERLGDTAWAHFKRDFLPPDPSVFPHNETQRAVSQIK